MKISDWVTPCFSKQPPILPTLLFLGEKSEASLFEKILKTQFPLYKKGAPTLGLEYTLQEFDLWNWTNV